MKFEKLVKELTELMGLPDKNYHGYAKWDFKLTIYREQSEYSKDSLKPQWSEECPLRKKVDIVLKAAGREVETRYLKASWMAKMATKVSALGELNISFSDCMHQFYIGWEHHNSEYACGSVFNDGTFTLGYEGFWITKDGIDPYSEEGEKDPNSIVSLNRELHDRVEGLLLSMGLKRR